MSLKITRQMVPVTNRNRPKSLLNAGPLYITVHETGNTNPGANAQQEANFLRNGGGPHSVAFHFAVDHLGAFQCLPLNVIGWHAGDGCDNRTHDIGCFASVAIETCVGDSNRHATATRKNLLLLIQAIITGDPQIDFGGTDPRRFHSQRISPHKRWSSYSKNCPTFMLKDGFMWTIVQKVTDALAGTIPSVPPTSYPAPSLIDALTPYRSGDPHTIPAMVIIPGGAQAIFVGDRVRAIRETPRLRFSWDSDEVIGPPIKADEEFVVDWLLLAPDKEPTYYSPWGTRIRVKDTARVADLRVAA